MTNWRLAKSLEVLRDAINTLAPRRARGWDGTIGDTAHQQRQSDHNPRNGIVYAMDITDDSPGGCNAEALAESLRTNKDSRIAYVIWHGRIFSTTIHPWEWRTYNGENQHNHHMHISVRDESADDVKPWNIRVADDKRGN